MASRFAGRLARLFYTVFALCFAWLVAHILNGSFYDYQDAPLLLCVLTALVLFVLIWRVIEKHEAALANYRWLITFCFLDAMLIVQVTFGWLLRYWPIYDVDAVFGGAIEWVETGTFASYYEYYSYFFNNFGGLCFFRAVFSAARALGITDYYMVAVAANAGLSACTMFLTGDVCARLLGEKGRFMAYALFLLSPPFYFIAPSFYTDALCMVFPILSYWLYLRAKATESRKRRLILFALMGVTAGVGILIKPVAAIAVIAIVIDAVLAWDWKRAALIAVSVAVCALACQALVEHTVYQHMDRGEAERNRTPLMHWVMMGLSGNGMYNPGDYVFTRSFEDREEQSAALLEEIGARIRSRGLNGMIDHLTGKADICFGDGTYGLQDCLGGVPVRESRLRSFLLTDGEHHAVYKHICAGVLLALYVLMVVSGAQEIFCADSKTFRYLAPRLAVFGLMLFLIWWEARWRYFSSYVPMIFVSALLGLPRFSEGMRTLRHRRLDACERLCSTEIHDSAE